MKRTTLIAVLLLLMSACGGQEQTIIPSFSDLHVSITEEGRLMLSGKTSLPDGTKLMSLISSLPEKKGLFTDAPLDYPESMDVVVSAGAFQSWFPTAYKNGVKAGKYVLQIGVLPNQEKLLGPLNAWLEGPGVVTQANGHKSYTPESEITLPDIPAHTNQ